GYTEPGKWFVQTNESRGRAMRLAEERSAYTVWGSFPFERFRGKHKSSLEVLMWDAPVLQRAKATVVVNPDKFPHVNADGAKALEDYLLSPGVQAAVATFREEGLDRQTWWPAARNNDPGRLLGIPTEDSGDE
ncbi:MAG TPA: hypothetical protein VLT59_05825, partial [Steroidobacteraceae bacterium]|nr:hypothetical protein [Steroidobacteraceae bacterium]